MTGYYFYFIYHFPFRIFGWVATILILDLRVLTVLKTIGRHSLKCKIGRNVNSCPMETISNILVFKLMTANTEIFISSKALKGTMTI